MIKIPASQAKRLSFSIKGYVFTKEKTTPQPVIGKASPKRKDRKKTKSNTIPLKKEGNIFRLDFNNKGKK